MKVTILGSGASGGVPLVGPDWGNCDPSNPKNQRRRSSILIEDDATCVLVDASPDCRAQLLDADISRLDGIVFTHAHADHCHGIDDLRWINQAMRKALPAFSDATAFAEMNKRFGYAFAPFEVPDHGYFNRPVLEWREAENGFSIGDLDFQCFEQDHGFSKTLGLRFGNVGYSTDVVRLDETAFEILAGVELFIVGCLREEPHPTHVNLPTVLTWIERIKPKRSVITHMNHMLDYEYVRARVPTGVVPAYDGLTLVL